MPEVSFIDETFGAKEKQSYAQVDLVSQILNPRLNFPKLNLYEVSDDGEIIGRKRGLG